MWKYARLNKEGKYEGKDLEDRVKAIDKYIEKVKSSKLLLKGTHGGILPKALKTYEHGGRVREGKLVDLRLASSKKIITYGTVISPIGDRLHGCQIPNDFLRISIDEVLDSSAPLPIPILCCLAV